MKRAQSVLYLLPTLSRSVSHPPCTPLHVPHSFSFAQADHTSIVKALYDYDANAPGELTVKEDEVLLVFDTEDEWLLVQSKNEGGKAGFVPANYVEVCSSPSLPLIYIVDTFIGCH